MMAETRTSTKTQTMARMSLIRIQVACALQETAAASKETTDRVMVGVREKWIEFLRIYGLDADGMAHAELRLRIDWQRHQMHIAAGRANVNLGPGRSADARSVILRECISIFNEYVAENGLTVEFHVSYPDYLSHQTEDMNRTLGLRTSQRPDWAAETIGEDMADPDLDELSAGIHLTET
jgi:hypothetical protein